MEHKLIFLALFLGNAQSICGFRYDQYDELPAAFNTKSGQQGTAKTQPEISYESHPPLSLLNKNREDKKLGEWVKKRFNSLGSDGLRKFQKATNSLRRNNIDESEVHDETAGRSLQDVCRLERKKQNVQSRRRTETQLFNDNDDADSTLDKKIQKLVWIGILQKYKHALDGLLTDDVEADTHESEDNKDSESNED